MKLTPLDVKKRDFSRTLRGYDTEEVRAFLEMVADELMNLQKSNEELRLRTTQLDTRLSDYKDLEEKWKATMMNAQQSAERELDHSRRESEIMKKEAEIKAEEILDDARRKVAKHREEMEMLRAEKAAFVKRLKHLISSQVDLLEILNSE
ncbi:MAG: DivIVA domain-containing protein [FCB group bacterium]|nr:DivIVA domain-containing protein [FCB group bacterium]